MRTTGLVLVALVAGVGAHALSSVDASTPYAWGQNIGWCNTYADDSGLAMTPAILSGYLWCQNVGWLNLGDGSPDTPPHYSNTTASDFGVNHDGAGGLSGYAWGQNIGWINFDTTGDGGSQVTVSPEGAFSGYAWAQNVGWINFDSGYGTQLVDTDGDTVPDAFETDTGIFVSAYETGTLASDPDTDGDTYSDGEEIDEGTDPTDPLDYPVGPIVVTAPNGGEEWSCGTTVTITWDCNDQGAVGDSVRIGLHKGTNLVDWIIRQTDNDGLYDWIVWTDVDPDSDYTIRVQSYTDNAVRDFSDGSFSIIPVGVITPNGGETWTMGNVYTIRWGSHDTAVGAEVRIGLHYGVDLLDWINRRTANDGTYLWKVPAELTPGYGYRVRVQSYTDSSARDLSDVPFTLELPPLLWTSPDLQDTLVMGQTYAVTWNCNDVGAVGADVRIGLHRGGAFIDWMIRKTENDGSWNWPVPVSLTPASSYRLRVQSYTDSDLRAMSPAFTIASP